MEQMEDELNGIMSEIKEISLPCGSARMDGRGVGSIIAKGAPAVLLKIQVATASAANIPAID
jgi:hypothetical protein